MADLPRYDLFTWASRHLNPDEFAAVEKYRPGQTPPAGEYLDARTGELVIVLEEQVPEGTIYLSVDSLREHGSYTL